MHTHTNPFFARLSQPPLDCVCTRIPKTYCSYVELCMFE